MYIYIFLMFWQVDFSINAFLYNPVFFILGI